MVIISQKNIVLGYPIVQGNNIYQLCYNLGDIILTFPEIGWAVSDPAGLLKITKIVNLLVV